jgi:hypothetical protein
VVGPLTQAFSSLVDSMKYALRVDELNGKVRETKLLLEKRSKVLDDLEGSISNLVGEKEGELGKEHTEELSSEISTFSSAALSQVKRKIESELKENIEEYNISISSERLKMVKSVESFLLTSPLPILDNVTYLTLRDGAYSLRTRYRCERDIEYEFMLDAKVYRQFRKELRVESLQNGLKVPVGLGKAWLKKDPSPEFQGIDDFVLESAEATEGSLIATWAEPSSKAKLTFVFSKRPDSSSLTLKYFDGSSEIELTSEPTLSKYLNTQALSSVAARLLILMEDIERHKTSLTRLVCGDKSLLETGDFQEFFDRSWKMIGPRVAALIRAPSENQPVTNSPQMETLDERMALEKIKQLRDHGQVVARVIGLELEQAHDVIEKQTS